MTVKQVIDVLSTYPPNMECYLKALHSEFTYSPVGLIEKKKIGFMEDPDDKVPLSKDTVIVISDEL